MTPCNGMNCCARRDCARWAGSEYWVGTQLYEPEAGYQCHAYAAKEPQEAPAWTRRIPELRRA